MLLAPRKRHPGGQTRRVLLVHFFLPQFLVNDPQTDLHLPGSAALAGLPRSFRFPAQAGCRAISVPNFRHNQSHCARMRLERHRRAKVCNARIHARKPPCGAAPANRSFAPSFPISRTVDANTRQSEASCTPESKRNIGRALPSLPLRSQRCASPRCAAQRRSHTGRIVRAMQPLRGTPDKVRQECDGQHDTDGRRRPDHYRRNVAHSVSRPTSCMPTVPCPCIFCHHAGAACGCKKYGSAKAQ